MLWLEHCSTMEAFHHSASTGHWPTVNSMLLTLSTQWMNTPSTKCRHEVRAGFHIVVFATGVNQEKWEVEGVQDCQHQWWKASPQTLFQL